MVDPELIKRFKQVSREDHLIAEIIARQLDISTVGSILEVGAGPGTISNTLASQARADCRVAVIEPSDAYRQSYSAKTKFYRNTWEDVHVEETYDLVLMSHVMGHFDPARRNDLVTRAADHLTPAGTLAIVTNGPGEPFWSLNLAIGRTQDMRYVIDFDSLESALKARFESCARIDAVTALRLGESEDEYTWLMNAFFPERFSAEERARVLQLKDALRQGDAYVLPMLQRTYLASNARHPASWNPTVKPLS